MRVRINQFAFQRPVELDEFEKRSNKYFKNQLDISRHIEAHICRKCATELYIEWRDYRYHYTHQEAFDWSRREFVPKYLYTEAEELDQLLIKQRDDYLEEKKHIKRICPVCGTLSDQSDWQCDSTSSHWLSLSLLDKDCFFERQEKIEYAIKDAYAATANVKQVKSTVTQFVQMCDLPVAPSFASTYSIKNDPQKLTDYILHLLQLETNIKSLPKYLEKLYCERNKNEVFVSQANYAPTIEAMRKKEYAQTKYNQAKREYETKLKDAATCRNNKPVPVAIPEPAYKPTEPQYRKPGLFNKKKVLAENELLKAQYQQDQEKYELECQQLVLESKQKDKENHEKHLKSIQLAEKAAEKARLAMESLEVNPKDFIPGPPKEVCPAKVKHQIICTEIEKTQTLLRDTYKARNELYAANVIFPKYRDIVALASFYEYLMAGRCTGLEGPNGAYNLYEAEIRANMIISKLSEIEKSLKKIEQNQYMIYSQLTEMNRTLDTINSTMDRAYEKISDIQVNTQDMKQYMAHIAENSDVIAHNTAVTAYYSKLNAELTNALGFMVALK